MRNDFIIHDSLADLDPGVHELIRRETQRQRDAIILVASESEAPAAVQAALASSFGHIYAEGYPRESSRKQTEADILDLDYELAYYRRHSDPRYYKGVEYADMLEALTRRRAAELFAANGWRPEQLFVNVQLLSGAPANNAVYTALLRPGDTLMGLKLSNGGHLTHGAPVNRSGQIYRSVSYSVDPVTERLDYDAIERLALQEKPKIIVAGYSAYPLIVDWQRFRQIADKVGAYLLADIAHISGLVAAGVHPSPIGVAHVVTTTTHKSLCGPRGAMILTHDKAIAQKIDKAVFPGEQGGPHLNTIAALAVTLKIAQGEQFRALQRRIVRNAARLADGLQAQGVRIVGGGSENHLVLFDCKSIRVDGVPLSGDMAARILDCAGIVANYNTIPGDRSATNPFGMRLGTVWISQRGFGDAEVDDLAEAIGSLLKGMTPFYYLGSSGKDLRAKVAPAALAHTREVVRRLTGATPPANGGAAVSVRGEEATPFLNAVATGDVLGLRDGDSAETRLHTPASTLDAILERLSAGQYQLHCADPAAAQIAAEWLADLSDGYVDFGDLHGKLPGPVVVRVTTAPRPVPNRDTPAVTAGKPFFIGQAAYPDSAELPPFTWTEPAEMPLRRTSLHAAHVALGAKMVPFGGWDMPVWYTSVSEEHAAVRQTAGLFDVSHMGVFEVSGPYSAEFLHLVTSNDVYMLDVGRSHYTYLLDADGQVIDDLLIYRLAAETFMLVVNASNNDKDWAWLNAINDGQVRLDNDRPWAAIQHPVRLRDLRDPQWGDECRVDIALQGPRSTDILLALGGDAALAARIKKLPWAGLTQGRLGGFDLVISRTGYTGERTAYELFVHPQQAPAFWAALLAAGQALGLKPCGLAARDSTRTEAGLPLYGHELAGHFEISPNEAGFVGYLKLWKPFFIGRKAYLARFLHQERTLVRFRMNEKGVRRPETGDPILDKRGKIVGLVTSCAIDSEGYLLGLAIVPNDLKKEGTTLPIYQLGGGARNLQLPKAIQLGARLPAPDMATVLTRFPE